MSLTGEGRRGQPSPPGPPGGAASWGRGLPRGLGPPPVSQGRALTWAGGLACGGEGRGEGGPVSLEVPVLQVAVLKGEAFLLPLAPLLVVKVDVGALAGGEGDQ